MNNILNDILNQSRHLSVNVIDDTHGITVIGNVHLIYTRFDVYPQIF